MNVCVKVLFKENSEMSKMIYMRNWTPFIIKKLDTNSVLSDGV